ncbi:hypothetical protein [Amycolatopsis australiensis]|uniref:Uncharacterized protein n=1 Tax=Amycolatopsis australiensis TaxID=546364 RepID=A0A1K1PWE3_9PSEU|nr:hypothetical protein [Amycolatopsis australiensis]SFW51158.1 hypothetical protein SAMN04489730_1033 [Amycolatopsis australiensis]
MNDLDDFRAALRQPPDEPFAEPDLARIMADGTRLRRRRRVLTGAAGIAAAAAVVLVVAFAVQVRQPAPAPVAQPPSPVSVTPTASAPPAAAPMGDVVGTGIQTKSGELVFFARAVDLPELPGVHFGLVAGFRSGSSLQSVLMANEIRGSDRSFGFHATDGGELAGNERIPVFGYFAGPAARITTTVHGRTVEAKLARWTEDPNVVIFWFDPAAVPNSGVLTPLIAYDAAGKRLTR